MTESNDPMVAVHRYVDAFNKGDVDAMAAVCADPMQILDGMSPHVWQGRRQLKIGGATYSPRGSISVRRVTASRSMSHGMSTSLARTDMSLFRRQ
ncbi:MULTISPECIES: nuclear transport factor 2 family protein [unclassified Mycolicibacterium]|uniref:nuclear transport factor 2 family protein n=1 Tax=unclassified Mycolicibacterium TaxID=2636767 RepID=UPI001EE4867C|nr:MULTISPECIES: nuclear transport factor 2 family protein [unclassified Mycolicibacterium]